MVQRGQTLPASGACFIASFCILNIQGLQTNRIARIGLISFLNCGLILDRLSVSVRAFLLPWGFDDLNGELGLGRVPLFVKSSKAAQFDGVEWGFGVWVD